MRTLPPNLLPYHLPYLLLFLLAPACGPSSPARPDFASAPTLNTKVTSIQFLPDAEVDRRFDELAAMVLGDPEPRVRDQIVLRLQARRDERALPVLLEVYRQDPRHEVARTALKALTDICTGKHGVIHLDAPPDPPPIPPCAPVYDGTSALPRLRPVPRVSAAEFFAAHDIPTRVTRNGEIVPATPADTRKLNLLYIEPPTRRGAVPTGAPPPPKP